MFSKKTLKKLSKTTILSLVFVLTLLGSVAPAFAAGEEKYRDLWGPYNNTTIANGTAGAIARTESGVYYIGTTLINNGTTQGIREFYLGANLMFPGVIDGQTPNEEIEKNFWDYVGNNNGGTSLSTSSGDTFVIRTYKIVNGQPDPASYTYNSNIYSPAYRATSSTIASSTGSVFVDVIGGISGITTTTIPTNTSTYGNNLYKQEDYTKNGTRYDKYIVNQKINIPIATTTPIPFGTTMGADFWYCGGNGPSTVGSGSFNANNVPAGFQDNVGFFPGLCSNTAYWKIGPSITFTLPASAGGAGSVTAAQAQSGTAYGQSSGSSDNLPNCAITGIGGSFMGCIALLVYHAIYRPIAWFAGILGSLFDFFLGYSLSDASYRAQFAVRGWQIVRDLSNIFFIIILVYTGLMAALTGASNMKKVVPQLILNALLINFSLFGTRVVIDLSNVVARVFYKSAQVCDGPCQKDSTGVVTNAKQGIAGYTPLSEKIVSSFNPQKIFSTNILSSASALPDNGSSAQGERKTLDKSDSEYAGYYIVISLIAAGILFAVAMMFWKTAFFFVGRVIGLYFAMIFAPFAVLSKGGMPIVNNVDALSWKKWSDDLISYALLAPIFVFFLYVIYSFLETDFIKVYSDKIGTSFFETVVYIAIPMIIVYFMISKGVSIAAKYAGDLGKAVTGFANKAAGLASGVALGAGGLAGGRVIGGLATSLNKSKAGEWLRDKGKSTGLGGWLARRSVSTLNSTEKASFDFRKSTVGQKLFKEMGVDTDQKALSALTGAGLGFGTSSTAGGYHGQVERYQKKQEEEGKLLESKQNQGDIDAYNEKKKKEYQEKVDTIIDQQLEAIHGKAQVDQWKATNKPRYEQERQVVLQNATTQTTINAVEKPVEKKSVQEMNAERKDKFSENLKKGTALDNFLGQESLIGAALGANTRTEGSKKAAKKLTESAKIEKDLTEINTTLKNGFREIVAMDQLKNDPLWTNSLTAAERTSLMRGDKITFTNSAGQQVEGGFYDYVKDKNPSLAGAVDIEVTTAENNKDRKKDILDQIKARQQFKFDFKTLNTDIKNAESAYANTPTQANLDTLNQLKAQRIKMKNEQKKWQDLDKYIEEQKKKLEGK